MDNDGLCGSFAAGLVVAIVAIIALAKCVPGSKIQRYDAAKDKCEAALPRNQHCVIDARPENQSSVARPAERAFVAVPEKQK